MRLAYFVHDLGDPAVARRLDMLAPRLAEAVVIGFHRGATPPATVAGWPAVPLGRTEDARLGRRILSVLRARLRLGAIGRHVRGATVVMSRQLETLALARAARARFAPGALLVQECLDVHRLLVGTAPKNLALRRLEGWLLRGCDLLLVSSPAFVREHLAPAHGAALPPVLLVENKVLAAEAFGQTPPPPALPAGPPWRIGWYGVIRCRRSLLLLADLVRRLPGRVEVEIRGRPARNVIPDFDAVVAATPGLDFLGPYDRRHDLPAMYGGVHFTWAIDYYEAGANSDWLLPNRLYEGSLHGAVPIALARVETGRWLAAHRAGLLLAEPLETALPGYFATLDAAGHAAAAAAVAGIPRGDLVEDGAALAAALLRPRGHGAAVPPAAGRPVEA
ncbi:glycosyl transferase family 1 [Dankookia sp. GCM10030260]|uniref:glycosyl transferase family 1 n=1 Tax=Dankookia sp. GCM10030260 TaxID=3273390 RepID=UPI0036186405